MATNPYTGQYTSPFAAGAGGLPTMAEMGQRRYDNAPGTMVSRALGRGVDTVQRNIGSTVEGIGRVTGLEGLERYGSGVVERNDQEIARSAAMENEGALNFITSVLGENAPQLAVSIGLPLVGAVVGGALGGPVGAAAGGAKGMTAARGLALGTAASGVFNYAMLAGEMRETQKFENERQGNGEEVDERRAFGAAIPAAALETLSGVLQARLAKRAFKAKDSPFFSRDTVGRATRTAGRGAAIEGPTEVGQQAMVRAQAGQTLDDEEALLEMATAGLAGAILGGTIGGAASLGGDARSVRQKALSTVKDEDLAAAVDNTLQLPPPPRQIEAPVIEGQPPQAQPEGAPALDLTGEPAQPPAQRWAESATDAEIFTAMQRIEQMAVQGQASNAEMTMLRGLRAEAEARDLDITPNTSGEQLFADQKTQDIRRAMKQLDTKAKKEGLGPEDIQLYREMQTEVDRRTEARGQPAPDPAQRSLFDDPTPTVTQQRAETKKVARDMGLAPGSKFYKSLRAKNVEELYDEVLDGVAKAERGEFDMSSDGNLDRSLANIAVEMGVERDFNAEIAQARAQIEALPWPSNAEVQTPEGAARFQEVQAQQAQIMSEVENLQTRQQMYEAAVQRQQAREAQRVASEAFVGAEAEAVPLTETVGETTTAEDVTFAPAQLVEVASQAQPDSAFGQQMREAMIRAGRQEEFDQAMAQRQEQQEQQADAAALDQEMAPTRVVSRRQPTGDTAVIAMSRGENLNLTRRDGAWYDGDRFVARKLSDAVDAAKTRRDIDAGIRSSMARAPFAGKSDLMLKAGPNRVKAVKAAIARAMEGWDAPYSVYVVKNFDDIPGTVRDQLGMYGEIEQSAGMMLPNGTVYLFADNVQSTQDAVATMFHEVLGHAGLQRTFGQQRAEVLMNMYENSPAVRDMYEAWRYTVDGEAFDNVYSKYPMHAQIEEALATMSEMGPLQVTFFQKMAKVVADFARRLGLNVKMGRAEVQAIMAEAHRRAMSPENPDQRLTDTPPPMDLQRPTTEPVATPAEVQDAANTYPDPVMAAPMLRLGARVMSGLPESPGGSDTAISRMMKIAEKGRDVLTGKIGVDARETTRSAALYFQSLGHIREQYGRMFVMTTPDGVKTNAIKVFDNARRLSGSIRQIYARIANQRMVEMDQLGAASQQDVRSLMAATFLRLDPNKSLDKHTHLTPQERASLRSQHAELVQTRNKLARQGKLKVYENMRAVNEATYTQQHALDLYDVIRSTPEVRKSIPAARRNPIIRFAEAHDIQSDPKKISEFWTKELETLTRQSKEFIAAQSKKTPSPQDAPRISTLMTTLQDQIARTESQTKAMKDYPYFHLARFGDYSATFSLKSITDENGAVRADPRAVEAVAEALHEIGFDNVQLSEDANGASVFIRTDHRSGAMQVVEMANRMMEQGFVDSRKPPEFGEVDALGQLPESSRRTLAAMISEIEAANAPNAGDDAAMVEAKQKYLGRVKADLQAAFLARLPDRSVAKVMARRGFKAGYDKNMVRGFAQRMEIASNASASRLAANMTSEALSEMSSATNVTSASNPNKWVMSSVTRELMRREESHPDTMVSGAVGQLRALNHNYYLAMNPGYTMTQITQMATNVVPELVKGGASFKASAQAIMSTFPTAFRIVKAVLAVAKQQGFKEHGADATVTSDILDTVQLSNDPVQDADLKKFVMRMYLSGVIDIGSASRALGRAAEGRNEGKLDFAMRWAGATNYHLEVLSRLNTALAAREIATKQGKQGDEIVDFAISTVDQSMLNYTESNRARAFGRQGMAGEFTPLASAFMTFQFHMTEKYMREVGTAFIDSAATPQEKAAARRWLGSHLAVMTTLAGSLGLPFVTVIARVFDALGDLFSDDEEPTDVKTAYRNFLSDTFGQDVGQVLARGLPRSAGFDISGRVGAADYFPFSRLIADRRDWDEALGDFTQRTYGAPFSMAQSLVEGGQMMAKGQVFEGMKQALPMALKNPMNAITIAEKGITDSRGNLLPVEPTTMAIIWQALGLSPAQRAEYSEANFSQAVRRGVVGRKAANLRRAVTVATQTGNADALREALANVREFDKNVSPNFRIMPTLDTSVRQAQRRQALARNLDAPLGVQPTDFRGRQMSRFANY